MLDLWDAQTCWRRALCSLRLYLGWQCVCVCVCVCVGGMGAEGRMCSDPARGCRGCRTVGTSCVASAWTRCGTSQRPSGFLASCPTAAIPTAWAACAPGGRAEGTSRWVSSSQCHGGASREGGKGPTEGWAQRQADGLVTTPLPPPTPSHPAGPVPSAVSLPATSSPANSG